MGAKENAVETALRLGVEELGGLCEPFKRRERIGIPDRLCTLPPPVGMVLVELKAPDGELSPMQERDHERRRCLGVMVAVCWTKQHVAELLAGWRARIAMKRTSRW